jgi:hypothetical protein
MSDFDEAMGDLNAAALEVCGVPITYLPSGAEPVSTVGILKKPEIQQSSAPGYFADLDVDPVVFARARKGETVVWADGTEYVIGRMLNPPFGLATIALHKKADGDLS